MYDMSNKKDQLLKSITDQLEVVAKGMLTTNTPDFNLNTEQEMSRISKEIDVFGNQFGEEDEIYLQLCSLVDQLFDKLKNRRMANMK
jgi:hypothetical protein